MHSVPLRSSRRCYKVLSMSHPVSASELCSARDYLLMKIERFAQSLVFCAHAHSTVSQEERTLWLDRLNDLLREYSRFIRVTRDINKFIECKALGPHANGMRHNRLDAVFQAAYLASHEDKWDKPLEEFSIDFASEVRGWVLECSPSQHLPTQNTEECVREVVSSMGSDFHQIRTDVRVEDSIKGEPVTRESNMIVVTGHCLRFALRTCPRLAAAQCVVLVLRRTSDTQVELTVRWKPATHVFFEARRATTSAFSVRTDAHVHSDLLIAGGITISTGGLFEGTSDGDNSHLIRAVLNAI
jgi:hypothetical protein